MRVMKSRMYPGKKDCVKVTKTGTKEKVQKRSQICMKFMCSLKTKQMKKLVFLHSVC